MSKLIEEISAKQAPVMALSTSGQSSRNAGGSGGGSMGQFPFFSGVGSVLGFNAGAASSASAGGEGAMINGDAMDVDGQHVAGKSRRCVLLSPRLTYGLAEGNVATAHPVRIGRGSVAATEFFPSRLEHCSDTLSLCSRRTSMQTDACRARQLSPSSRACTRVSKTSMVGGRTGWRVRA